MKLHVSPSSIFHCGSVGINHCNTLLLTTFISIILQLIFSLWLAVTVVSIAGQQTEEAQEDGPGDELKNIREKINRKARKINQIKQFVGGILETKYPDPDPGHNKSQHLISFFAEISSSGKSPT